MSPRSGGERRSASRRRHGRGVRACCVALFALAAASALAAGDVAKGRDKAAACAACHGENGVSVVPNAPNLAGQPELYLAEQLRLYRSGKRSHEVMGVIARPLSDEDIDALAAWFASIEVTTRLPK